MELTTGYFILAMSGLWGLGVVIGVALGNFLASDQKRRSEWEKAIKIAKELKKLGREIGREKYKLFKGLFGKRTKDLIRASPEIQKFLSDPYGIENASEYIRKFAISLRSGKKNPYLLAKAREILKKAGNSEDPYVRESISSLIAEFYELSTDLGLRFD